MAGFLDATPARFRHWSLLAFGAWSTVIWLSRLRNIVADDDLSGGAKVAWMVPAVVFGIGGLVVLAAWWQGRPSLLRPVVAVIVATVLYWPVRAVAILLGGESTAFRVVHTVLAVVSVALAVAAGKRLVRTNLIPRGAYR